MCAILDMFLAFTQVFPNPKSTKYKENSIIENSFTMKKPQSHVHIIYPCTVYIVGIGAKICREITLILTSPIRSFALGCLVAERCHMYRIASVVHKSLSATQFKKYCISLVAHFLDFNFNQNTEIYRRRMWFVGKASHTLLTFFSKEVP